jgi:hypothetical protein
MACGQKGPPLAPLHLVPAPVADVTLRRIDDRARLRFVLPTRNANGPGRLELDHVEIYAITAPPGVTPPNRLLFSKAYVVGRIPVRPAPIEGEPPAEGDTRPGPGDAVTFDEVLTPDKLKPVDLKIEEEPPAGRGAKPAGAPAAPKGTAAPGTAGPQPGAPATGTQTAGPGTPASPPATPATPAGQPATPAAGTGPPGAPATGQPAASADKPATQGAGQPGAPGAAVPATAPGQDPAAPATASPDAAKQAAAPAKPTDPVRIYAIRGVTRSGRFGPPSGRLQFPVVALPAPPESVAPTLTESGVVLTWKPSEDAPAAAFNVYSAAETTDPLNPGPLTEPKFEHAGVALGKEQCYALRSVLSVGAVQVEGGLSEAACITPTDIFPPAAPKGLAAVPTPGQISLIWDANTEADVAGYVVLRGDAGGGELQPLTPKPIRETSYRDTTVAAGSRYVYAVVAVDGATPPNTSEPSARVEETAR